MRLSQFINLYEIFNRVKYYQVNASNILSLIDRLISVYRFTLIIINIAVYYIQSNLKLNSIDFNIDIFLYANLIYFLYALTLELFGIRTKYDDRRSRLIRLNIDLIYLVVMAVFNIDIMNYSMVLFYIPLIVYINYKNNKSIIYRSIFIILYFYLSQYILFILNIKNSYNVLMIAFLFTLLVIISSTVLLVSELRMDGQLKSLDKIRVFLTSLKCSSNYAESLSKIIDELQRLVEVPIITIMIFDDNDKELFIAKSTGIDEKQKNLRLRPGMGVCGSAFLKQKEIYVRDTRDKDNNSNYIEFDNLPQPVLSELVFPLILNIDNDETRIGVLNFESYEIDDFKQHRIDLIRGLVGHIVYVLEQSYNQYNLIRNIQNKIDIYRETALFMRYVAHDLRNKCT